MFPKGPIANIFNNNNPLISMLEKSEQLHQIQMLDLGPGQYFILELHQ